jgi:hypothetical protein
LPEAFCGALGDIIYKERPQAGRGCVFIDSRELSAGFRVKWGAYCAPHGTADLTGEKNPYIPVIFGKLMYYTHEE